jgi:ArsR family transcriptional regulator
MKAVFKALNDPTRRRILEMLKARDLTAGEIADAFDISRPSISHHLSILQNAELVGVTRDGQFLSYSIDTTVLEDAVAWLLQLSKIEPESTSDLPKSKEKP